MYGRRLQGSGGGVYGLAPLVILTRYHVTRNCADFPSIAFRQFTQVKSSKIGQCAFLY